MAFLKLLRKVVLLQNWILVQLKYFDAGLNNGVNISEIEISIFNGAVSS